MKCTLTERVHVALRYLLMADGKKKKRYIIGQSLQSGQQTGIREQSGEQVHSMAFSSICCLFAH